MGVPPPPISAEELEEMLLDPSVPDEDIRPYLMQDAARGGAFEPRVRVNPSMVLEPGPSEGAVPSSAMMLSSLNAIARWRRLHRYRLRIQGGWRGLRLVSEGDSWFQYPFLLEDVVDHLDADFAIFSLDGAGDTLADYLRQDEVVAAVLAERPHAVILSGGGNDLLGAGRLRQVVEPHRPGRPAEDHLGAAFARRLSEVVGDYRTLLARLAAAAPRTPVIIHAYDHAIPAGGRWLGLPLAELGIRAPALQRAIVRLIVDRFHGALEDLADESAQPVTLVNCRGSVPAGGWHDELHPDGPSFGIVAGRFRSALRDALGAAPSLGAPVLPPPPAAASAAVALAQAHDAEVLTHELGRRLLLATAPGPAPMSDADLALVAPSSVNGAWDGARDLGARAARRIQGDLRDLLCDETADPVPDGRDALRQAVDAGGETLAATLAAVLSETGAGLPATAVPVAAALLLRRGFAATWQDTCLAWGAPAPPGPAPARPGGGL